jgi:hypothetical protein
MYRVEDLYHAVRATQSSHALPEEEIFKLLVAKR